MKTIINLMRCPNAGYLTGLVDITSGENNVVGTFVNQKNEWHGISTHGQVVMLVNNYKP